VMRKAFPGARIVVVIRDPRDVAASIKERLGSLDEAIHRWNRDNDLVRHEVERHRADLIVVSYEQLIAAPEKTLMTISAHIGIEYHHGMLDFYKDDRTWFGANNPHGRLRNWQIHQPLTDRRGRWATILSEAEARCVEDKCRELMSFFGYLPPTHSSAATRIVGTSWRQLKEIVRPTRRRLRQWLGKKRRR
jgi:protein O-GlcNAc transferase